MLQALLLLAGQGVGDCPAIRIEHTASEHLTYDYFRARIDPVPGAPLTYRWTSSGGQVRPLDDASQVVVASDLAAISKADVVYDLALDVGGLPAACPHRASEHVVVSRFEPIPERDVRDFGLAHVTCPAIRIESVPGRVGRVEHRVTLDPMPKTPVTYDWRVSKGQIVAGQGTPVMTQDVPISLGGDTRALDYDINIIIGGLPRVCPSLEAQTRTISY